MKTIYIYKKLCISAMITLCSASLLSSVSYAQGSLLLTPKRVVFNGGKTSENINLANSGKDRKSTRLNSSHRL